MLAVIATGGKQYKVTENMVISIDRMPLEVGSEVVFDKVHLVQDGDNVLMGDELKSYKVKGLVTAHTRGPKISVIKFKRRKRYLRNIGHKQKFIEVKITSISGKKTAKAAKAAK
jgi:large subunit ribosomal protein L21